MTTHQPRALCAIPNCYIRGAHTEGALEDPNHTATGKNPCKGCLPAETADGLLICQSHHDRALFDLARIVSNDDALQIALKPYRSPQAPQPEGGHSGDAPNQIEFDIPDLRAAINMRLSQFCYFVAVENKVNPPKRQDLEGMAAFMARHANKLSRSPVTATTWGAAVREVANRGARAAYRTNARGVFLGSCPVTVSRKGNPEPCGAPVRYTPREDVDTDDPLNWRLTCRSCGKAESLEWWRSQIAGHIEATNLAAPPLATWLSHQLKRPISPSTVRGWAFEGMLEPAEYDAKGRPLYDRDAAQAVATDPAIARRRARERKRRAEVQEALTS